MVSLAKLFSSRFLRCVPCLRCLIHPSGVKADACWLWPLVSLMKPFSGRFVPCLVHARLYRLTRLLAGVEKRPRRTFARFPRAVPWENALPWAALIISQSATAVPVRDDRGRGFACAKAVDKSINRDARTSVTAKSPNACVCCGAGRRRGGRPNGARTRRSKPSRPRPNVRAVSACHLHPKLQRHLRLRRRVVTQQKLFHRLLCATGRGAMSRLGSRAATRRATAAPPAARPFAGCWIANTSGSAVVLSRAAAHVSRSTRPPARGVAESHPTPPRDATTAAAPVTRTMGRSGRQSMAWFGTLANLGQSVHVRSRVAQQESQA